MADANVEATRPVGEVPGRRATQMDTVRAGLLGEGLAEFLGTFVLISFGDGVVAMAVAALNQSGRAQNASTIFLASGDWLLITWGWAIAVVMGVYVAGGVTGAHINPSWVRLSSSRATRSCEGFGPSRRLACMCR